MSFYSEISYPWRAPLVCCINFATPVKDPNMFLHVSVSTFLQMLVFSHLQPFLQGSEHLCYAKSMKFQHKLKEAVDVN